MTDTQSPNELKPCPFCASNSIFIESCGVIAGKHHFEACCSQCNARGTIGCEKEATVAWNLRAAEIEHDAILNNLGDLKAPWEALRPYVNATPELISLLYDLDLMPEQIHVRRNFIRMMQLAEWHQLTRQHKAEQPITPSVVPPDTYPAEPSPEVVERVAMAIATALKERQVTYRESAADIGGDGSDMRVRHEVVRYVSSPINQAKAAITAMQEGK